MPGMGVTAAPPRPLGFVKGGAALGAAAAAGVPIKGIQLSHPRLGGGGFAAPGFAAAGFTAAPRWLRPFSAALSAGARAAALGAAS